MPAPGPDFDATAAFAGVPFGAGADLDADVDFGGEVDFGVEVEVALIPFSLALSLSFSTCAAFSFFSRLLALFALEAVVFPLVCLDVGVGVGGGGFVAPGGATGVTCEHRGTGAALQPRLPSCERGASNVGMETGEPGH